MGTASDTTPKPDQLIEVSKVILKLPFPDLPEKALKITNGVIPKGIAFPSTSTLEADPETVLRAAKAVRQVLKAMADEAEARYTGPNIPDLQERMMALIKMLRLSALSFQSLRNINYLGRLEARSRLRDCRRTLLGARKLKKRLRSAYMISITLKEDVELIKQTREVKALVEKFQKLVADEEAFLKRLEAQDQNYEKFLTGTKRQVSTVEKLFSQLETEGHGMTVTGSGALE
jgi:hypothetical protein